MTENTKEWLDLAMGECGETEINEVVVLAAIEYIEFVLTDKKRSEDLLSLDELEDMLCTFE